MSQDLMRSKGEWVSLKETHRNNTTFMNKTRETIYMKSTTVQSKSLQQFLVMIRSKKFKTSLRLQVKETQEGNILNISGVLCLLLQTKFLIVGNQS